MAQKNNNRKRENRGGRPRKFSESSRPITVTLPDRTLNLLQSLDTDRAKSITKAVDWVTRATNAENPAVEIVEVENGRAVIVVGPSRCLKTISWLRLVEIAPSRFLLVLPVGTAVETLEVAVMDMIDNLPKNDAYERKLLSDLRLHLTQKRRSKKMSKAELLLIDISD